eukprot:COSAG01_NODE_251_length_20305_cov_5.846447_22_plen_108_part_00
MLGGTGERGHACLALTARVAHIGPCVCPPPPSRCPHELYHPPQARGEYEALWEGAAAAGKQHEPGAPRGPCYSVQAADDVATAAWELLQRVHSAIAVCMACSVRPRP